MPEISFPGSSDILQKQKQKEELEKAYEEYENFCKEDDLHWWIDRENTSIKDTGSDM